MSTVLWEFEAADPEVGILTDDVTHCCEANEDYASAVTADVSHTTAADGKTVTTLTTLECPVCAATTAYTEQWPVWMFED